ncbi:MAG TPA: hypothetical protein VFG42_16025 [Baekduia sp.]|uniref:hypothetical protein n=1 Tax=Baekduia sp. TaxID=2600305 RepID=UPI002D7686AD|nr:hypothetical protein [Baekduia sp.]HET6508301.1 hypothetical protein [Baekduia sp.]
MRAVGSILLGLSTVAYLVFWFLLVFGGPTWLVIVTGVVGLPGEVVALTQLNVARWRRWRPRGERA